MKYTTKQLFEMNQDELHKICKCNCETSKCPFKPSLKKLREDGYCVRDTYRFTDSWVAEDECEIKDLEYHIKILKDRIENYKKWKKILSKEIK